MVVLIVVLREPFGTLAANAARGMCPRPGVVGVVLPATAAPAKLSRRLLPRPPLHVVRVPVTDKPTRLADGPAPNRVAGGHMRMSAILSRHSAKRDGGTPPAGGPLPRARKKER